MDINKMEYDFLVKSVLGQKLELNNGAKDISDSIIEACIARADRDMLTAGCNYLIANKMEMRRKTLKNSLKESHYSFSREIIEQYSKDIKTMIRADKDLKDKEVSYGLAQKSVNMAFKYLYVFKRYIDKKMDFRNCDCPLDSVILGKIGEKDVLWSQINPNDYVNIQEKIKSRLLDEIKRDQEYKELYGEIGNLLFDFINW